MLPLPVLAVNWPTTPVSVMSPLPVEARTSPEPESEATMSPLPVLRLAAFMASFSAMSPEPVRASTAPEMPATLTSPEPVLAFTVFTPVTVTSPDPAPATTPVAAGTLISYEIDTACRTVSSVMRPTLTASPVCSIGGLAATCLCDLGGIGRHVRALVHRDRALDDDGAAGAGADADVAAARGDIERGCRADRAASVRRDRLRDSQDGARVNNEAASAGEKRRDIEGSLGTTQRL